MQVTLLSFDEVSHLCHQHALNQSDWSHGKRTTLAMEWSRFTLQLQPLLLQRHGSVSLIAKPLESHVWNVDRNSSLPNSHTIHSINCMYFYKVNYYYPHYLQNISMFKSFKLRSLLTLFLHCSNKGLYLINRRHQTPPVNLLCWKGVTDSFFSFGSCPQMRFLFICIQMWFKHMVILLWLNIKNLQVQCHCYLYHWL